MSNLPDFFEINPKDEAERLWKESNNILGNSDKDVFSLCLALDFGIRAIELLAISKLQKVSSDFSSTIAILLETPPPDVNVEKDAINMPKTMDFTNLIDLLSEESLDCCSPKMHHGWIEKRVSCLEARQIAQKVTNVTISKDERGILLLLSAYRSRIFRLPPPLRIVPKDILQGYPVLNEVFTQLNK